MQPVDMNKLSTGDRQRTQVEEGQLVGGGTRSGPDLGVLLISLHEAGCVSKTKTWDLEFPTRFGTWVVIRTATNASP